MSWDDWVFGILTGGLYNIGKTAYKASKAADAAGDAVEEIAESAGATLAILGDTVARLGGDLESFINELEELVTIKRATPRDEEDLWDEEVERLNALRQREAELLHELEQLGASDREDFSWHDIFWGALIGELEEFFEEFRIRSKLAVVRAAIREILYEEPGVIPTSIYHFKEILERFNTLEQPRIEEIMDSGQDNLEEIYEILQEVKRLFVVKTWRPVPDEELTPEKRDRLRKLESMLETYNELIERNLKITEELRKVIVNVQPSDLVVKPLGTAKVKGVSEKMSLEMAKPAVEHSMNLARTQPVGIKVATLLKRNEVTGILGNYNFAKGVAKYYERERLKIEKEIFRIKWVAVEEPGLIPKILDEVRQTVGHVRSEELPRVDNVLDSVNLTVLEMKGVLQNLNKSAESSQA